jgi:type IV pilus assembly protein PilX
VRGKELNAMKKSFINPVRNSSEALNPAEIILKCNPAIKQRGIISNGVKNQGGVALVIALIMLLVLTLIGINAVTTTNYETNISGNLRVYDSAFYMADGGVEDFLERAANDNNIKYSQLFTPTTLPTVTIGGSSNYTVTYEKLYVQLNVGAMDSYFYRVRAEGVVPNFPTAGRVLIEAIVELTVPLGSVGYN